jgi:hypothetical protein
LQPLHRHVIRLRVVTDRRAWFEFVRVLDCGHGVVVLSLQLIDGHLGAQQSVVVYSTSWNIK